MLTKQESSVMSAIFSLCKEKGSCLVSPLDLIKLSNTPERLTEKELEEIVKELEYDDYFDVVYSSRNGEKIFCITLHEKGEGFLRSKRMQKRNLLFRLGVSIGFAILSFIIGLILKAIF